MSNIINACVSIQAAIDRVYLVLTDSSMLWWGMPVLTRPDALKVVFEEKLGGRLYERWSGGDADEGAFIATVVALRKPELLVLEGRFGMPQISVVTFELVPNGLSTDVSITHAGVMKEFDGEEQMALKVVWTAFLNRLKLVVELAMRPILDVMNREFVESLLDEQSLASNDPQTIAENAYQELQSALIQVRQATAQAIATEKQLESQMKKNEEQAAIWQRRAEMAADQDNEELQKQALQRNKQYSAASEDLMFQWQAQKEATDNLRQRLTELENQVQQAYTRAQVLIARDKAADAVEKATKAFEVTDTISGAMSVLNKLEQHVIEKEARVASMNETTSTESTKSPSTDSADE